MLPFGSAGAKACNLGSRSAGQCCVAFGAIFSILQHGLQSQRTRATSTVIQRWILFGSQLLVVLWEAAEDSCPAPQAGSMVR
mmetsp:Transcript_67441/g.161794  ORF Transcript_67441/g.161794 Transcript_67441/m.161794 type:complete len:82 (-) Transcript_67441:8-253(-)